MNNEYATKDLHFAAYLYVKKIPMVRLERRTSEYKDRNPVYFIFEGKEECDKLDRTFWGEGDMINIRDYIATIRDLRARAASVNHQVTEERIDETPKET